MKKMTKIILSTLMVLTMTIANAQNKKEQIENLTFSLDSLNQVVAGERQNFNTTLDSLNQLLSKHQQDFELEMDKSSITINNLNNQLIKMNAINNSINIQLKTKDQKIDSLTLMIQNLLTDMNSYKIHLQALKKNEALFNDAKTENEILRDSIENLQKSVDSVNTFSHITHFVQAFYNSLELSEAENQRQYEVGDVRFDIDNFSCLIGKNAKYSKKRVDNLSDENYHDRYYIELLSIEDIKFENNNIIVSTKVLHVGSEMGSFYNEEQLTLQDNKGLLKLTSWLDVDLYKMELSEYEHMDNFTIADFYEWLGSYNKN